MTKYRPRTDPDTRVTFLEPEIAESTYSWDQRPYTSSSPEPPIVDQIRALLMPVIGIGEQ